MLAVNYSDLRNNLKEYCDKAVNDMETVLVTRKEDRHVVMISLEAYNNLVENDHIMKDPVHYKELIRRAEEVDQGLFKEQKLSDE